VGDVLIEMEEAPAAEPSQAWAVEEEEEVIASYSHV